MKTIVKMKFGSHLYGTNTLESDLDFKSVHIPNGQDILLQCPSNSISNCKQKLEGEKNSSEDIDMESFSLQKYLNLLCQGQTVALDMLFAPEPMIIESSPIWKYIQKNKERFFTKNSVSFVGYCRTQANKYGIKGSRMHSAKLAAEFFEQALKLLGPTAKISEISSGFSDILTEHNKLIELPIGPVNSKLEWYFESCNRKTCFTNTIKQAAKVYRLIYDNFGERARKASRNENIDWKALSHAVRVATEALELLKYKRITFPIPSASHLLAIKLGKLPYKEVAEEIEDLLKQVEQASITSSLQEFPDIKFKNQIISSVYYKQVINDFKIY